MSVDAVEIVIDPDNPGENISQPNRVEIWFQTIDTAYKAIHQFEQLTHTKHIVFFKTKGAKTIFFDHGDRVPFSVIQRIKLECQHGPDRNKACNEKRKAARSEFKKNKNYVRAQSSIKVGCTADIRIVEAIKYPEFQAMSLSKTHKDSMSQELRMSLAKGDQNILKERACRVSFPLPAAHHGHELGVPCERGHGVMDRRVLAKIGKLAEEGILSLKDIQHQLRKYVLDEIFQNQQAPSKSYRRFFPTRKVICEHYVQACIKQNKIQVEGNKLTLFVDDWENSATATNDNVFQMYISSSGADNTESGAKSDKGDDDPIRVFPMVAKIAEEYANHVPMPENVVLEEPLYVSPDDVMKRVMTLLGNIRDAADYDKRVVYDLLEIESNLSDTLTEIMQRSRDHDHVRPKAKRRKNITDSDPEANDENINEPKLELHIDTSPLPTFQHTISKTQRAVKTTPSLLFEDIRPPVTSS